MKIAVSIEGISPLLMHRLIQESLMPGADKVDKYALPRDIAESHTYRNENGELYIPGLCIFSAIKYAGKFHQIGKNKITTTKSSLVCAYIQIDQIQCLLGTKDFEVDTRAITNNALGGARLLSHRPRLDKWNTSFTLTVDQNPNDKNSFSEKLVRFLVDDAGKKAGLLSYRPSCGGQFGRFVVTHWEIIK